jgi:hypothetical protein
MPDAALLLGLVELYPRQRDLGLCLVLFILRHRILRQQVLHTLVILLRVPELFAAILDIALRFGLQARQADLGLLDRGFQPRQRLALLYGIADFDQYIFQHRFHRAAELDIHFRLHQAVEFGGDGGRGLRNREHRHQKHQGGYRYPPALPSSRRFYLKFDGS